MSNLKEVLKNVEQKKTASPEKTVQDMIYAMIPQIKMALPSHLNPQRMARIALTCVRLNPALLNCTQQSLAGAIIQASQLGLEPGILGQCYIIPYGKEAQFQIGYKGLIALAHRTKELAGIQVHAVYPSDEFIYSYGSDAHVKHIPDINRGDEKAIAFYCIVRMKSGFEAFSVMSIREIERHRDKYSKARSQNSPWNSSFEEMAMKTVLKKVFKYLPFSIEILDLMSKDNTISDAENNSIKMVYDDLVNPSQVNVLDDLSEGEKEKIKKTEEELYAMQSG